MNNDLLKHERTGLVLLILAGIIVFLGVLLFGCVHRPPLNEWPCRDWQGSGDVRIIELTAMTTDFNCSERICWGLKDGACWYHCPEDRMPAYCSFR